MVGRRDAFIAARERPGDGDPELLATGQRPGVLAEELGLETAGR
jgi:hypothetical protein